MRRPVFSRRTECHRLGSSRLVSIFARSGGKRIRKVSVYYLGLAIASLGWNILRSLCGLDRCANLVWWRCFTVFHCVLSFSRNLEESEFYDCRPKLIMLPALPSRPENQTASLPRDLSPTRGPLQQEPRCDGHTIIPSSEATSALEDRQPLSMIREISVIQKY